MEDREDEAAADVQEARHVGEQTRDVIDVGQPEVARDDIELHPQASKSESDTSATKNSMLCGADSSARARWSRLCGQSRRRRRMTRPALPTPERSGHDHRRGRDNVARRSARRAPRVRSLPARCNRPDPLHRSAPRPHSEPASGHSTFRPRRVVARSSATSVLDGVTSAVTTRIHLMPSQQHDLSFPAVA